MPGAPRSPLERVLEEGRALGYLGPGHIGEHVRHAAAFGIAAERLLGGPPATMLDLGSGSGVPGLALAQRWPQTSIALLDASRRRCASLRSWAERLGVSGRCRVLEGRGEVLAQRHELRGRFSLVVARSFGVPAITAEIGGPFVGPRGLLLVSEPPDGAARASKRWPLHELLGLGFDAPRRLVTDGAHFAGMRRVGPTPARFPRRTGIPAKRPLW